MTAPHPAGEPLSSRRQGLCPFLLLHGIGENAGKRSDLHFFQIVPCCFVHFLQKSVRIMNPIWTNDWLSAATSVQPFSRKVNMNSQTTDLLSLKWLFAERPVILLFAGVSTLSAAQARISCFPVRCQLPELLRFSPPGSRRDVPARTPE